MAQYVIHAMIRSGIKVYEFYLSKPYEKKKGRRFLGDE